MDILLKFYDWDQRRAETLEWHWFLQMCSKQNELTVCKCDFFQCEGKKYIYIFISLVHICKCNLHCGSVYLSFEELPSPPCSSLPSPPPSSAAHPLAGCIHHTQHNIRVNCCSASCLHRILPRCQPATNVIFLLRLLRLLLLTPSPVPLLRIAAVMRKSWIIE